MCTMSWQRSRTGETLTIWFNRDESRSRAAATGPLVQQRPDGDFRWISCIDPEGGGSWLAVNEAGTCFALLNHYSGSPLPDPDGRDYTSRGRLVVEAASLLADPEASGDWLADRVEKGRFRPFLFVALNSRTAGLWRWDAGQLQRRPAELPLTTSSFETAEVTAARRDAYRQTGGGESFHRWFDASHSAFSTIMSREDAHTVSLSRIKIGRGNRAAYSYATAPDWAWGATTRLGVKSPFPSSRP